MTGTSRVGARARWVLARAVLTAFGGVRTTGRFPDTPCVLVANHSSHADTAVLLAAVPAGRRPVVAAAADYWFGGGWRRLVGRWLVGAFPVRRDGGGSADLASAAALLAAGHDVIVYPEGTRSRDGSIGHFHTGAARLATQAGVPMVPIGIHGTGELWPVHDRPHRGRVTVRIGTPAHDTAAAEAAVRDLTSQPRSHRRDPYRAARAARDSRLRLRVAELAAGGTGEALVLGWAFAEALSWPLLPEFALAVLAVAAPRRAPRLALLAAAGSLAGGAVAYLLAARGWAPPAPLTTARMHATAATQTAAEGAHALAHQPLSGIPYKVYATAAGRAHVGLGSFMAASVTARCIRILAAGLVLGLFGGLTRRWRRWYPAYLATFLVLFSGALAGIITYWSKP